MNEEQLQAIVKMASDLSVAYEQVHAILLRMYDDDIRPLFEIETRVLVSEADARLDTAAEIVAQLARKQAVQP